MSKKFIPLIGIAVIAAVVIGTQLTKPTAEQKAAAPAPTQPTSAEVRSGKMVTAEITYQTPAGSDPVGFELTVDAAGVITEAKTKVLAKAPISVKRQEAFQQEFPTAVVGKKLADLSALDRIGGSSLTTKAFNEALTQLKAQAGS